MADDNRNTKPQSSNNPPPPPLDPFPTYQSSFPRPPKGPNSNAEDDNPFIQFRRFADQQFSSLFQSLGIDFSDWSTRGATEAENWVKEWQRQNEEMCRRRQKMEEGMKKQWEQEKEERRRGAEEHTQRVEERAQRPREMRHDDMGVWGIVIPGNSGFGLGPTPHHPATELEMYEVNEQMRPKRNGEWGWGASCPRTGQQMTNEEVVQQVPNRKTGWFTLGYDGRQRMSSKEGIEKEHDQLMKTAVPYSTRSTKRLDPVGNPDHTLPWLLINPYSPLYVCNPSSERLVGAFFAQSPQGTLNVLRPWFVQRTPTSVEEQLAKRVPWADAFEDLVSLQNTGKMCERNFSTWRTPDDWVLGMASRGSLRGWEVTEEGNMIRNKEVGPRWRKDKTRWQRMRERKEQKEAERKESQGQDIEATGNSPPSPYPAAWYRSEPATAMEIELWPSPEAVTDAIRTAQETPQETPQETQKDSTTLPEILTTTESSGPTAASTEFFTSASTSSWSRSGRSSDEADSIVSTLTTTERTTMPDGSVETKRVMKKKFADGREENTESVERENGSRQPTMQPRTKATPRLIEWPKDKIMQNKETQTDREQMRTPEKNERKSGWFWN